MEIRIQSCAFLLFFSVLFTQANSSNYNGMFILKKPVISLKVSSIGHDYFFDSCTNKTTEDYPKQ